jgi:hypothetical protein
MGSGPSPSRKTSSENSFAPEMTRPRRERISSWLIKDGFDQIEIPGPKIFEITGRDFSSGNILVARRFDDVLSQMKQPATVMFMFPEAPSREQKIEMREVVEDERFPLKNESGFQEGQIEGFAVVGQNRPEIHLFEQPGQVGEQAVFFARVAEKILGDDKPAVPEKTQSDEKRQGSRPPGQTGRFQVEKEGRREVEVPKSLLPAQIPQNFPADGQPVGELQFSVAGFEGIRVLEVLDGRPGFGLERNRPFRPGSAFPPGQVDQPLELFLGRETLFPPDPGPCFLDGRGRTSEPLFPLLLEAFDFLVEIHADRRPSSPMFP